MILNYFNPFYAFSDVWGSELNDFGKTRGMGHVRFALSVNSGLVRSKPSWEFLDDFDELNPNKGISPY